VLHIPEGEEVPVRSLVLLALLILPVVSGVQFTCTVSGLPFGAEYWVYDEGRLVQSGTTGMVDVLVVTFEGWVPGDSVVLFVNSRRMDISACNGGSVTFTPEVGGLDAVLGIVVVVLLYFGARWVGCDLLGELVIGGSLGVIWELATRRMWVYHGPVTLIGGVHGFPVGLVFWWAANLAVASLLAQLLYGRYGIPRGLGRLPVFTLAVLVVSVPMEFVGWTMNAWDYVGLSFFVVTLGWVAVGSIFLTFIDYYQSSVERVLGAY